MLYAHSYILLYLYLHIDHCLKSSYAHSTITASGLCSLPLYIRPTPVFHTAELAIAITLASAIKNCTTVTGHVMQCQCLYV